MEASASNAAHSLVSMRSVIFMWDVQSNAKSARLQDHCPSGRSWDGCAAGIFSYVPRHVTRAARIIFLLGAYQPTPCTTSCCALRVSSCSTTHSIERIISSLQWLIYLLCAEPSFNTMLSCISGSSASSLRSVFSTATSDFGPFRSTAYKTRIADAPMHVK